METHTYDGGFGILLGLYRLNTEWHAGSADMAVLLIRPLVVAIRFFTGGVVAGFRIDLYLSSSFWSFLIRASFSSNSDSNSSMRSSLCRNSSIFSFSDNCKSLSVPMILSSASKIISYYGTTWYLHHHIVTSAFCWWLDSAQWIYSHKMGDSLTMSPHMKYNLVIQALIAHQLNIVIELQVQMNYNVVSTCWRLNSFADTFRSLFTT